MTIGPSFVRLEPHDDLQVPDNEVTKVQPWLLADDNGISPGYVQNDCYYFTEQCWAEVSIHMDWPLDSDAGFRRMEARLARVGGGFEPRIAACQVGEEAGDGYNYSASGPIEFFPGDRVYAEVKQRSGAATVLQSTNVTWMVIRRLIV